MLFCFKPPGSLNKKGMIKFSVSERVLKIQEDFTRFLNVGPVSILFISSITTSAAVFLKYLSSSQVKNKNKFKIQP